MPKIADKMEELPDYVLAEVRRLFLEENLGALKISKTIESNFGVKLPSLFVVDKYLDSLKKNNDNVIPQEEVEEGPKVSALEGLKIDTSSLKNQNESFL